MAKARRARAATKGRKRKVAAKAARKKAAPRKAAGGKATARKAAPRKAAGAKPARKRRAAKRPAPRPPAPVVEELAGIGNRTVAARTGRGWGEWLEVLDAAGGGAMPHTARARWLHNTHGLDGWWAQMVAVGYEQARGLREAHQKPAGFEISKSKTIRATAAAAFAAFKDGRQRRRWLEGAAALELHTAHPGRSIRFGWGDRGSWFEARFYSKTKGRVAVTVQHGKLTSSAEALHLKGYWDEQLERLRAFLED